MDDSPAGQSPPSSTPSPAMQVGLQYRGGDIDRRASELLYKFSFWCSLLPGAVGLIILFLFAVTRADTFIRIGFFWLFIGGIIAGAGLILSIIYFVQAWHSTIDQSRAMRRAWICLFLAFANFPVAFFCMLAGIGLMNMFRP